MHSENYTCKICPKCKIEKSLDEFYNKKSTKDGLSSWCKTCGKQDTKDYIIKNKSNVYKKQKIYYKKNALKIAKRDKIKRQTLEYKQKFNEYCRNYLKEPEHKLRHSMRVRMGQVIRKGFKRKSSIELLGCDILFFKLWIEKRFTEGMSWENYGKWHIDHIIPCFSFDLTKEECQKICFHYTNLQPLWAEENFSKNKYINNAYHNITLQQETEGENKSSPKELPTLGETHIYPPAGWTSDNTGGWGWGDTTST